MATPEPAPFVLWRTPPGGPRERFAEGTIVEATGVLDVTWVQPPFQLPRTETADGEAIPPLTLGQVAPFLLAAGHTGFRFELEVDGEPQALPEPEA